MEEDRSSSSERRPYRWEAWVKKGSPVVREERGRRRLARAERGIWLGAVIEKSCFPERFEGRKGLVEVRVVTGRGVEFGGRE